MPDRSSLAWDVRETFIQSSSVILSVHYLYRFEEILTETFASESTLGTYCTIIIMMSISVNRTRSYLHVEMKLYLFGGIGNSKTT